MELTELTWWERLIVAYRLRSMATVIPAAMIPIGIIGLALGQNSSSAFTILSAGPVLAHGFGALLAIGGAIVVIGIVRSDVFVEGLGLILISGGTFTYSAGVLLGLGWKGAIAGGIALAISVGALGRVFALNAIGKAAKQNQDDAQYGGP